LTSKEIRIKNLARELKSKNVKSKNLIN